MPAKNTVSFKLIMAIVALAAILLAVVILRKPKTAVNITPDPREQSRVIDTPSISYIKTLAKNQPDAVFVFTKAYPELQDLPSKTILIKPVNQDISINYDEYLHKEFMGPIYILLPSYYIGIRASVILKCFPAYKGFSLKEISDNYVVYYADQRR